jgi:hypothetical protein
MPGDDLPDGIPEMTLDKNLAAERPAAKVDTTAPAVPAKVAAEMEKNKAAKGRAKTHCHGQIGGRGGKSRID